MKPKMQLDTDLRRYFKDLNKTYTHLWVISVFLVSIVGWFNRPRLNRNVWHCSRFCVGSRPIVLLNLVVQSAKIEPAQARRMG